MGYSDRIRVEYSGGNDYPLKGIAAAFIALQVEPKEDVVDYLMEHGQRV